jgi:uncharacterized membrane protein YbhN (UPF0104 family)
VPIADISLVPYGEVAKWGASVKTVFRKILKLLFIGFAVWLLAVIGLLALFTIVRQPNPWLLPLARSWAATMSVLAVALLVRQIWKWSNSKAARYTSLCIGIAVIGLSIVGALTFLLTPTDAPDTTKLKAPESPTDVFHGSKRIACDAEWSTLQNQDPGPYREFLKSCMEDKSGKP